MCTVGHEEEQPPSLAIRTENENSKSPLCKASHLRPRLAQLCTITPSKLQLHSQKAGVALQNQSCEPKGFCECRTPSSMGWKRSPSSLMVQASGERVVMECVPFREEIEMCRQKLWSHTLTSIPVSMCKDPSPWCTCIPGFISSLSGSGPA